MVLEVRGVTSVNNGGGDGTYFKTVPIPVGAEAGDLLILFAFGGNRPTQVDGGTTWTQVDNQLGQEAQGGVYSRTMVAGDTSAIVYYDGYDPYRIVMVAIAGMAGHQLFLNSRVGTAGQTLAPTTLTQSTTVQKNNLMLYFVGNRNAIAMPTLNIGDLRASYTGTHTMGFWTYAQPDADGSVDAAIGLPQRSGHYAIALRVYAIRKGAWQDDATPVGVKFPKRSTATYDSTGQPNPYRFGASFFDEAELNTRAAAFAYLYGGNGTQFDETSGAPELVVDMRSGVGKNGYDEVTWAQVSVKVDEPTYTVTGGAPLPEGWDDDPNVVGVEFEPTSTPVSRDLTLNIETVDAFSPGKHGNQKTLGALAGTEIYVKMSASFALRTSLQWRRLEKTILRIPVPLPEAGTFEPYTLETVAKDVDTQGLPIYITLVDYFSHEGVVPDPRPNTPNEWYAIYPFTIYLTAYYRPRYRLLYQGEEPVPPVELPVMLGALGPARREFARNRPR